MLPVDRNKIRRMVLREMHEMGMAQMDQAGRVFHNNGPSQESSMIKSNLYTISRKAQEMHDEIKHYDDLPEWVQEKIAVAESMIGSVYDYLDYEYYKLNNPEPVQSIEGSAAFLNEKKKKDGRVVKGKYHGQTYKATSAMKKAIEKGASYEELLKMADWADNPDAVVNAALIAVKGKPASKNEGS
jgi:hypothetical protein